MLKYFFLLHGVFVVPKAYLPFTVNRLMDRIYRVVKRTVVRFDPPLHKQMPVQLLCQMNACQAAQLFYQLPAPLCRNESGGFHRVHQQLKLRQFKC